MDLFIIIKTFSELSLGRLKDQFLPEIDVIHAIYAFKSRNRRWHSNNKT